MNSDSQQYNLNSALDTLNINKTTDDKELIDINLPVNIILIESSQSFDYRMKPNFMSQNSVNHYKQLQNRVSYQPIASTEYFEF